MTLLRDPERPLGKIFHADGSKTATASVARATAETVRCETHQDLVQLYERVGNDPHAALILDHFVGIPVGEPFEIHSQASMRKLLGRPSHVRADVTGVQTISRDGRSVKAVTRFKENFAPSVWLVIDRDIDEHTPANFAALSDEGYFSALSKAMPGIDSVTRIRTLSSSARAMRG